MSCYLGQIVNQRVGDTYAELGTDCEHSRGERNVCLFTRVIHQVVKFLVIVQPVDISILACSDGYIDAIAAKVEGGAIDRITRAAFRAIDLV
jgi:hypothetical protein